MRNFVIIREKYELFDDKERTLMEGNKPKDTKEYKIRKEVVRKCGLTVDAIAEAYGVSWSIANTELNEITPPIKFAVTVAKLCNCNVEYLLGLTESNTPPEKYEINLRIKEIMKSWHIEATKLGKQCGISPSTIYNYKNGKTNPTLRRIVAIANTLGVSVDYLIGLTDTLSWNVESPSANEIKKTIQRENMTEREMKKYAKGLGYSLDFTLTSLLDEEKEK